ncbi:YwgA family protein [Halalkalibacterium halodurans]|uniref:BH3817 protein n=2 Tax=Halalkalibacterium halodurans TaxID=86665 RepID=Q9K6B2_HALH5|nr:YwgA family protein [Halalkalibacterium halodurans]MED3646473.1 YwgA family protein [Halalkalibacterium halodurans]MED4079526.1 YwgA family protein [Halalkalibacterium halodurans]MED4084197.1 YwgA family protein [Halalkalibacterium halodurans]MED4104675.1 YwgA family protein [Halalkalibacterium halodurans]MED4108403.1 YwgA family protein [Halalkalibacterium halodurans]
MLKDHAKLMAMLLHAGEIVGRKKLQKMVYIAKKVEMPFSERYKFHMYGPYSEELTLRVEELCNLGFVTELKEDKGNYYQYRYSLSEEGKKFLELHEADVLEGKRIIEQMNEQSSRFLELVSTLLYFEDLSPEEVKEKVKTLKPKQNYTDEDIEEASSFIKRIRMEH